MSKIITQDQISEVEKHGKAKVIGNKISDDYMIDVCCVNNPSHTWTANFYNLKNGSGCPECRYKFKHDTDSFNIMLSNKNIPVKLISKYTGRTTNGIFQCLQNLDHEPFIGKLNSVISKEKICPTCKREMETKRKNEVLNNLKEDAIISGYEILDDEFINEKTKLRCRCFKNPKHITYKRPRDIREHTQCKECYKSEAVYLCNSVCLWEQRPDIAEFLLNKDDGYKYSFGSNIKLDFVCPICKSKINKRIADVSRYGLTCRNCSSINSYPNRFMYQVLQQVGIEFKNEFNEDWTMGKRYDFYFELDKKYFIEMDGIFHSVGIYKDVKMQQETDKLKDEIAKKHNIQIIRINCFYHKEKERYEYVKNNILNSELSQILDFSNVDFDYCDFYAQSPYVILIANSWNDGIRELSKLSDIIGIHKDTISKILKRCFDFGLIKETPTEVHQILRKTGIETAVKKRYLKNKIIKEAV